ncbi:quinone oxidoreductase [Leptospira ryugenii]|uniref:Quinone oxidoreductase n=1 Tax=Leptospira ryugenii TaxID=1917863 RepID=A0A2P2DVJ6_9LEPT|nr:NAD(P)-dependent alcohol dehydrogenase [Leptospira ryugenii]GBF48658.1 quinone oxidoreductase [Leptospira ryugenii]
MKVIYCETYGPPEVLRLVEISKPQPKNNEILVKIQATTVNSGDVRVRGFVVSGLKKLLMRLVLGWSRPRNPVLGLVFSGIIEEVGRDVTKFQVGDEIFGMTGFRMGTYAEYICLKESSVQAKKPAQSSFGEIAALVFGGTTALYFLKKAGIHKAKKSVLVIGGTGSVGVASIQYALSCGAEVSAVCGPSGMALVKKLGVEKVYDYSKGNLDAQLDTYDVIFDTVGKYSKKDFIKNLSPKGIYLTVESWDVATESIEMLEEIVSLLKAGKMPAVIDRTFSLEQIVDAHRYVDSGRKKGNVVIQVV